MAALRSGIKREPVDGRTETGKQYGKAAGNKKCSRAVVRKYCGNEDAAKVMLKIIKLLSENSGGV